MSNVAARVLFLYESRTAWREMDYMHLAPKMRDNDTRCIKEYVPLIVTERKAIAEFRRDREQPASLSEGAAGWFYRKKINFNLCLICSMSLSRNK